MNSGQEEREAMSTEEQTERSAVLDAMLETWDSEYFIVPANTMRSRFERIYERHIDPLVRERDDATAAREANGRRLLVAGKRIAVLERQVAALKAAMRRDYEPGCDCSCCDLVRTGFTTVALEPSTAQQEGGPDE